MSKSKGILSKSKLILLSQNPKMNNLITQIRKKSGLLTKHLDLLLTLKTKLNVQNTDIKKQSSCDFLIAKYIC